MATIDLETRVETSREAVFRVVSDAATFGEAVGGVRSLKCLSDTRSGVGTRFRQTRVQGGREALFIRRAVAKDLAAVKAYCEARLADQPGVGQAG